jgi:hypothetical protein
MSELLKRLGIVPGPGFQFGRNHATACPKCQHPPEAPARQAALDQTHQRGIVVSLLALRMERV